MRCYKLSYNISKKRLNDLIHKGLEYEKEHGIEQPEKETIKSKLDERYNVLLEKYNQLETDYNDLRHQYNYAGDELTRRIAWLEEKERTLFRIIDNITNTKENNPPPTKETATIPNAVNLEDEIVRLKKNWNLSKTQQKNKYNELKRKYDNLVHNAKEKIIAELNNQYPDVPFNIDAFTPEELSNAIDKCFSVGGEDNE